MALRKIPFSDGSSTNSLTSVSNIQYDTTANKIMSQVSYTPSTPAHWPVVPTTVSGALDELAQNASVIYLPAFVERIGLGTGTSNYTVGGYSASGTNNGFFCLKDNGSIIGGAVNVQATGLVGGEVLGFTCENLTAPQSQLTFTLLSVSAQQQHIFTFATPVTFSPTDQLRFSCTFTMTVPTAYISTSVMFQCNITS